MFPISVIGTLATTALIKALEFLASKKCNFRHILQEFIFFLLQGSAGASPSYLGTKAELHPGQA